MGGGRGGAVVVACGVACAGAWSGGCGGTRAIVPGALHAPAPSVLVLSVDGLHGKDLDLFLGTHPQSALAALAAGGVRFTNVSAPKPSDSFPTTLALFTGGSPGSTGVYYDLSYDRSLSPPGSDCSTRGARVDYTEAIDADSNRLDGGGGMQVSAMPRDPANGCREVPPHAYLRVNTAFEVVKSALGRRTAWSDKHLSYEILQGPSGAGIDDLFDPEIAAKGVEKSLTAIEAYDDSKVDAVVNQIHGKDHLGAPADVPALYGMNFQAVSVEQKSAGYADAAGTPSADLQQALEHTDASIGRIVSELHATGLWSTTVLIVAAAHGQAPIDHTLVRDVVTTVVPEVVATVKAGLLAQFTGDDVGLLWLTDQGRTADVKAALMENAAAAGVATVLAGADLAALYPDPATDPRTPDLIIETQPGVIYSDTVKLGEHGGFSDEDTKVALLVANAGGPGVVTDAVETRQIAATILSALGIDPGRLAAVQKEQTATLPRLSMRPDTL